VLLALVAGGCIWPRQQGPAPRELIECRQLSSQAAHAMQRSDYERAETLLAEAVKKYGFDPETRRQYAETLWRRGERAKALEELNRALELSSEDAALLTLRAQWRLALADAAAARADVDLALDQNPQNAAAWLLRARIARQTDDLPSALADYHRALAIEPAHREALWEKAQVHQLLAQRQAAVEYVLAADQWQRALATLQTLLESYPQGQEPPDVLLLTGQTYSALARHEDAARTLTIAAQRSPPNAELLYYLAEAQLRAGRPADALAQVRQSLTIAPGHAPSQELLARIQWALAQRVDGRPTPR
jgi:tetratricopeptide (TPR) repeat protein